MDATSTAKLGPKPSRAEKWWNRLQPMMPVFGMCAALLFLAAVSCGLWLKRRAEIAGTLHSVLTAPAVSKPHDVLMQVNARYRNMTPEQQHAALGDPDKMTALFAESTVMELRRTLTPLFKLPEAARRRIFATSADHVRTSWQRGDGSPKAATSPAGRGVLLGVTTYYETELNVQQRSEVAPLTAVVPGGVGQRLEQSAMH